MTTPEAIAIIFAVCLLYFYGGITRMVKRRNHQPKQPPPQPSTMSDRQFIAFVKGNDHYVFVYDDTECDRHELLRTFGRFAANADLNFTWYDAVVLTQQVREKIRDEASVEVKLNPDIKIRGER